VTNQLATPIDQWDARFGFFWYSDREIFRGTAADFERRTAGFAAAGINHVITFSGTHFRWSFRRDWERITATLARVVEACHHAGIRVTEHHSSHLTFNPLDREQEDWMDRILAAHASSRAAWPHLRADCDADPDIGGARLSSCRQVDGRTGQWARSSYGGWCLCFNNPDYRRAYLDYLATLYPVGIDGIMTDDVQWFGAGHACACGHCRRLFRERHGHELPPPGPGWERWHGNHDDPSYLAWLDFRLRSIEAFHAAVGDHYRRLGLRLLRPNYDSHALVRNPTAYALETLPDLDWVFQECCDSAIIRYSWPAWAVEASHRFAVGRRRQIPPMALFYPETRDDLAFTWALATSWGMLYLASSLRGRSLTEAEQPFRSFENRHARLLRDPQRLCRLAFYDSRVSRDFYRDAETRSLAALKTWIQACCRRNVPFDLFQREELDRLPLYRVVVLNEVAWLADDELAAFRRFVSAGGVLVWTGRTGTMTELGRPRTADALARAWGVAGTVGVADGAPSVTHPVGAGRLLVVAGDFGSRPAEPERWADRYREPPLRVPFQAVPPEAPAVWRQITDWLTGLLPGGPDLVTENLPGDVLVTAFETRDGNSIALHLVNAAGTLTVRDGDPVSHRDPIPFPRHEGPRIRLAVRKSDSWRQRPVVRTDYCDPDRARAAELRFADRGDLVQIEIEPQRINRYGLLRLET